MAGFRSACVHAILLAVLSAPAPPALALANRVFVSARSGSDANACDNVATPCQTLTGAVAQLNPAGEAIVLDSGGYGAVTITRSVTIEAPPGVTAFIHPSSGDAVTIDAGAGDTVVLRGLVLNAGANNGLTVNTVGAVFVENCAISNFENYGIQMGGAGRLTVRNTDVKGCFVGVQVSPSSGAVTASLDHCHLDGNIYGYFAASAAPGRSATTATHSTGNNNLVSGWTTGQTTDGLDILNLEFCSGSANDFYGIASDSSNASSVIRFSNCVFSNNGLYGVARLDSGTIESRTNNTVTGNGTAPTLGTIGAFLPQ